MWARNRWLVAALMTLVSCEAPRRTWQVYWPPANAQVDAALVGSWVQVPERDRALIFINDGKVEIRYSPSQSGPLGYWRTEGESLIVTPIDEEGQGAEHPSRYLIEGDLLRLSPGFDLDEPAFTMMKRAQLKTGSSN
jgi:hypothetical protein